MDSIGFQGVGKMRKMGVLALLLVLFGSLTIASGTEYRMNLEVVETSGDWEKTTPMYFETEDSDNPVYAEVNATNINGVEDELYALQYLKYIVDFIDYEEPTVSKTRVEYVHYTIINFTESDNQIRIGFGWWLDWTLGVVTFQGTLSAFFNNQIVFSDDVYDSDAHQYEIQLWRTKSNQLRMYYNIGEIDTNDGFKTLDVLSDWNVGNFTYYFETNDYPGYFTADYEDLSYLSGVNEGIQDPIENSDWGFFEPIRQIFLGILNLFMGLIRVILPDGIENMLDDFLDALGDFVEPITEIILFIAANFLSLIIAMNLLLLLNGMEQAEKGNIADVMTPFFSFYGFIINVSFAVIRFIVSVIQTIVSIIPL